MRRTTSVLTATMFAAAMGVVAAGPASASAAPAWGHPHHDAVKTSPYVALGDSYSSAAGVQPSVVGSPPVCSRSTLNYAHDIAAVTKPTSFTDVTCSGAKTSDFYSSQSAGVAPQLDAVTNKTRLVTMTIGGNDEDVFVDSFFGCAAISSTDITGNPCQKKYGSTFTDEIVNQTYPHLVAALRAVHERAPHATVAIVGYPEILPATGSLACYPAMPISLGDVPWLHHEENVLNSVVRRAALKTGSRFIDMAPSSTGHDACQPESKRWIEPAVGPVNAFPVHPNAVGEAAMARQTLLQLCIRAHAGR
ncbi:SGNH/GDSL hydrolase family protein [Allobranchiibius sp. GilTou38]|uniref:SGNH/GDSL hydrolase family protein n=1 Tax=Allobranchiibius sp. GilTou38 TaxID=2815210 RepID=UPI001AA18241|nr:SGNH/GDSL hydrolase family protein [Allobranchiibius sp. GilTou38]MBO1765477.1 SGNH/GDSL hydrolase family protein [Allobranchiibius sp. GilTou38]